MLGGAQGSCSQPTCGGREAREGEGRLRRRDAPGGGGHLIVVLAGSMHSIEARTCRAAMLGGLSVAALNPPAVRGKAGEGVRKKDGGRGGDAIAHLCIASVHESMCMRACACTVCSGNLYPAASPLTPVLPTRSLVTSGGLCGNCTPVYGVSA